MTGCSSTNELEPHYQSMKLRVIASSKLLNKKNSNHNPEVILKHLLPSTSSILDVKDLTLPKCTTDPKFVAVSVGILLYNINQTVLLFSDKVNLLCALIVNLIQSF